MMRGEFIKKQTAGHFPGMEIKRVQEELYSILLDKIGGEALGKVENVIEGEGLLAYWRVYWWCTDTTPIRMSDRRNELTGPKKCTNDANKTIYLHMSLNMRILFMGHIFFHCSHRIHKRKSCFRHRLLRFKKNACLKMTRYIHNA